MDVDSVVVDEDEMVMGGARMVSECERGLCSSYLEPVVS